MTFGGKTTSALLFLGDLLVFALSLWLTLLVRYGSIPSIELLADHAGIFSMLFVLWILVFYMSGLYGKSVILFKTRLFGALLRTQILNIVLAALVFFFTPGIGIAPKTNLVLYLFISLGLILCWRLYFFPRVSRPVARTRAALIGSGPEVEELLAEVNNNARYHLEFSLVIKPEHLSSVEELRTRLEDAQVTALVLATDQEALYPHLKSLYRLAFIEPGYPVLDFYEVYEEVFDRVPLSLLRYEWFLKHMSGTSSLFYAAVKRFIDIGGALAMGLVTLLVLPFVALAMRLEGPGPLFIRQERIGKYGTRVGVFKFRSMRFSDAGKWKGEGENRVTRVGAILRQTSLDEFPQCINVLFGDMSLIGPRNDMRDLGERLGQAIPYYGIRYLVTPGITGWAQINQQYEQGNISPQSIEETKMRLAYDFYYIKNRSLALDIVIALKTVKRMLFRVSSW